MESTPTRRAPRAAYQTAYRAKNAEMVALKAAAYYARNAAAIKAQQAIYYAANAAAIKARQAVYHAANAPALNAQQAIYRAIHRPAGSARNSWRAMRDRCNNLNADRYPYYGGRGITVCERWSSYSDFLVDMGERSPGTTLDRIDPEGNYEPSNCRWATAVEQANNKRPRSTAVPTGQQPLTPTHP